MLYIYYCPNDDCKHEQDECHGMMEDPKIKCEKCKTTMKRKVTGGGGFIRKGSGWVKKG